MKHVVRKSGVVKREIGGETFLVPVSGRLADLHNLFVLNEVGVFIWDELDGKQGAEDLGRGIADVFDIDFATATEDARQFIRELREAQLLDTDP